MIPAEHHTICEDGIADNCCGDNGDSCIDVLRRVSRSKGYPDLGGSPNDRQHRQLYPHSIPSGRSTDNRTVKQEL